MENLKGEVLSKHGVLLKAINSLGTSENFEKCGQIIDCQVARIDKKSGLVYLDLGLRADAALSIKEFFKKDERANLKVGDMVKVKLTALDYRGIPLVNHAEITRSESFIKIKEIYQKPEEERIVQGIPFAKIGRLIVVDVEGFICLLPVNQVELKTMEDVGFIGTVQNFKILKIEGENVLLSKKSILNEDEAKEVSALMEIIKEGDIAECEVKAIFPYGVFVSIKSLKSPETGNIVEVKSSQVTGFVYISDIAWNKTGHPSEHLSVGDKVFAKVLKSKNEGQHKIALSIKDLTENPRAKLLEIFKEGDIVSGVITEIPDHGIFVDFNAKSDASQKYEGFIHNSEISWKKEGQNNKKFKVGEEVQAKIIELDIEKKKVPLSIKSLEESPVKIYCQNFKDGDILEAKISRILPYGLILSLNSELDILLHAKDMFWNLNNYEYFLKKYRIDDVIKVKYLGYCDNLNRVKITTKDIDDNVDPLIKYKDYLKQDEIVLAKVVDVKLDRVYVSIFDSMILALKAFDLPKNLTLSDLKIDQDIKVKIIGFEDSENSTPIISARDVQHEKVKRVKKYDSGNQTQSGSSLGDILEFALDKAVSEKNSKKD